MNKKKVYLLGCSFTHHAKFVKCMEVLKEQYNITNLGDCSRSNFQILEDIRSLDDNSVAIIQWSALTRPNGIIRDDKDWNEELNRIAEESDDPFNYYMDNFINIVEEANEILKQKNIKNFQYVGWQMWGDDELSEEQRNRLNNLTINWFSHDKVLDIIFGDCYSVSESLFNRPASTLLGKYGYQRQVQSVWYPTNWGGMNEWIRKNISDPDKRWLQAIKNGEFEDAHPSNYATNAFYDAIIIPEIERLVNE